MLQRRMSSGRNTFLSIGPIQAFVIGFPDSDLFEGRIAEELRRLSDVGKIRVLDAVFVMRDSDDAAAVSVSDLDDDQRAELRSAVGGLIGLGVARGIVIAHHSLTPEDLIALGMAIGDEAELEAQLDADVADADTKE